MFFMSEKHGNQPNHTPSSPAHSLFLSDWLQSRGIHVASQLRFVQWALPLLLTGIVFFDEVKEHVFGDGQGFFNENFLIEVFVFGILGPVAVWLVLWWIRGILAAREQDQQRLLRMYEDLEDAQARLHAFHVQRGDLLNRLMTVQEEERRRLAREMHDELGQLLTGLSIRLRACQELISDRPEDARQCLERSNQLVLEIIERTHTIVVSLRPTVLDDYGLAPALQDELEQRMTPAHIDATLEVKGDLATVAGATYTVAYRIIQEALTNVLRHAHARHVWVRVHRQDDLLHVTVADDGVGLPSWLLHENGRRGPSSLGILGMKERAMSVGGKLTVASNQPRGAKVEFWLPVGDPETEPALQKELAL